VRILADSPSKESYQICKGFIISVDSEDEEQEIITGNENMDYKQKEGNIFTLKLETERTSETVVSYHIIIYVITQKTT
jgi:hypothetical protein